MMYLHPLKPLIETQVLPLITHTTSAWTKADGTPVTAIDLAIQKELITLIESYYPSHRILYEEGEPQHSLKSSDFTWVIDPIDGTANFLEGKKEYSIAIGLMKGTEFIESLVIFPASGESFYATQGEGVYRNGEKMPIPEPNLEARELIFCSRTYQQAQPRIKNYNLTFYRCATYSVLRVLTGQSLAFLAANTMLYDVGPISHIATEAGIQCLSGANQVISYRPELTRIPIFLAVSPQVSLDLRQQILSF